MAVPSCCANATTPAYYLPSLFLLTRTSAHGTIKYNSYTNSFLYCKVCSIN